MTVTNADLLDALHDFQEGVSAQFREVQQNQTDTFVALARLETWRDDHEKRVNGLNGKFESLRNRMTVQGVVVGLGEVILAIIAILRGVP